MTNKKKIVIGGLMTLILGLGMAGSTFAYQGDFTKTGPNHTLERQSQMAQIIEKGDYQSWKTLMETKAYNGRVDEVINKDNFSKFAEAWRLAREGKIKEANTIRRELGLRTSDGQRSFNGNGRGQGKGLGQGNGLGQGMHRFNR